MATSVQADVGSFGNLEVSGRLRCTSYVNDAATAGNRTVNAMRGKNSIAIGASAVTITNSLVTTASQIIVTLEFIDATLTTILTVVPGSGSFVVTGNANATAATQIGWVVIN